MSKYFVDFSSSIGHVDKDRGNILETIIGLEFNPGEGWILRITDLSDKPILKINLDKEELNMLHNMIMGIGAYILEEEE